VSREILFRGKGVDNGEWVYGDLFVSKMSGCFILNCKIHTTKKRDGSITMGDKLEQREIIPETVGQYTGLKDCKDKKIFEGDILACKFIPEYYARISWDGPPDAIAKVIWDLSGYRLHAQGKDDLRYADFVDLSRSHSEIIGNIHDKESEGE
jgi:uncharacterized phage protein (TIGR01671 family)